MVKHNLNLAAVAHTYSIVAFDPERRQIGGAMQTHNFGACNGVIWVQPGIGVIASQAESDPFYAFAGFEMIRLGKTPAQILNSLTRCDPDAQRNQVAIIDAQGNVAAYTSENCIEEAGHHVGKHYSCQANMMLKNTVWSAMGAAFENTSGELVDRIMAALEAAEQEGGDIRGAQSAVIKVVSSEAVAKPWEGYIYDFRVYDSPQPLKELQRLIDTDRKYQQLIDAEELLYGSNPPDDQKMALSIAQFQEAIGGMPNEDSRLQYQCSYALTLLAKGNRVEALSIFRNVFAANPIYREAVRRVARAEPDNLDPQLIELVLSL
jgi:uncharacterized Ntn-hydrolase superfamily protein